MAFNAQCSWHTITTKSSELLILILAVVSKTQTQANNFLATEIILLTKHKETDTTLICCLIENIQEPTLLLLVHVRLAHSIFLISGAHFFCWCTQMFPLQNKNTPN